jgi:hypothetical protein
MIYQSKFNDKISILIKKLSTLSKDNKIKWSLIDNIDPNNEMLINYLKNTKNISKERSYFSKINSGFMYFYTILDKNKEIDYYLIATQVKENSNLKELSSKNKDNKRHQELLESLLNMIEDNDIDDFINDILIME